MGQAERPGSAGAGKAQEGKENQARSGRGSRGMHGLCICAAAAPAALVTAWTLPLLLPALQPAGAEGGGTAAAPGAVGVGAMALGIMSRLIQVVRMVHQVRGTRGC